MSDVKTKYDFNALKYQIIRVKTLSFFVKEEFKLNNPEDVVFSELGQVMGINIDESVIEFRLMVYFFYPNHKENKIAEIVVQNVFKVENMKNYTDGKIIHVPTSLVVNIIGMAISHTRALLCANLYGTVYQDYVLPITDTVSVVKHFYPLMFDEKNMLKKETEFLLTPPMVAPF